MFLFTNLSILHSYCNDSRIHGRNVIKRDRILPLGMVSGVSLYYLYILPSARGSACVVPTQIKSSLDIIMALELYTYIPQYYNTRSKPSQLSTRLRKIHQNGRVVDFQN